MDAQTAIDSLREPKDLSILILSSQLLAPTSTRNSTSSNDQPLTPPLLAADLAHYRDLFSKLRFSYVEQVTKERFLRAFTAETPDFVAEGENAELEAKLAEDKRVLGEKKREVRDLIAMLEEQGRSIAGRYESVQLRTRRLEELPGEIEGLVAAVERLRESQAPKSDDPKLAMGLQPTLELLKEREDELASLDERLAAVRERLPQAQRDVRELEEQLGPLEVRKNVVVDEAREARKRRANGGLGDELEDRGRWLSATETGLRAMLEV